MTKSAKVIDISPAQLRRTLRNPPAEGRAATIFDDVADGIEAIHQLSNLAHFSERPRAFIFALATAAHQTGEKFVELFDAELAELQGCSVKTVQRQRADYKRESKARRFGFVEIIEGDYDRAQGKNVPTRYRFHIGGQIAEAVELARQAQDWPEMERQQQRLAIARACEEVFHTIPDARQERRKGRRPRLATAEIETCQKVVETKLAKLRERAAVLPAFEHERLMENPGELREWWLKQRAAMDAFLGLPSPETVDTSDVDRGGGQIVHPLQAVHPPSGHVPVDRDINNTRTLTPPEPEPVEHTPEAVSLFDNICERLTTPKVQTGEIELNTPPPAEDLDVGMLAERAAILEYDGGLDRISAEARAGEVLRE